MVTEMTIEKETLYKTAYSPLFDCYVAIIKARKDDKGEWIFHCKNTDEGLIDQMFRKSELINFCL